MSFSVALRCVIASAAFLLAESAAVAKKEPWDGNYVIVLPDALQRTTEHKFSVQVQSKNVALRIDSNATDGKQFVTGQLSVLPDGTGIVKYRIPFDNYKGRSVQLFFTAFTCEGDVKKCADSPDRRLFKKNVSLPIMEVNMMLFTETSKPIYKPGDLVRFRALPLLADLLQPSEFVAGKKAALVFDIIYIVAPNNIRMAQWKKLSWLDALRGLSFQLTNDPLFGNWKIVSQIGDVKDELIFTVKEYVLPKFTVSIKPPSYIFINDSTVKFSVCPKYSTGRPMKALVKAKLCVTPKYKSRYARYKTRPCINVVKVLNGTKECADFEVSTKVLELRNKKINFWNSRAFVNATVIENGTDFAITKVEFGGRLETAPFKIILMIPDTYRQWLPFYGQVQTLNHDGSVRPNENITCHVATYFGMGWGFSQDYTSDANGIINFGIPPFPPYQSSISIQCRSKKKSSITTNSQILRIRWPSLYHSIRQVYSLSGTHIQIYPLALQTPQNPCASGKLNILLQSNVALYSRTIHVLSTSRRNIQTVQSFGPITAPASKCKDQDSVELGHYKCVEQADGSYKIRCLPGWKGDNCLTPICENGCMKGICRAPNTCTCKTGWSGVACNKCEKRKGCVEGYCHFGNDCYCRKGYRGYLLPVPIDTLDVKKEKTYDPKTTLEDLRFFSRKLQITIDPQLYPSSKIVLWFTHKSQNGSEFVATSIELKNLQDCLSKSTPVSFSFNKKTVRPGEQLTASIKTSGSGASCALAISDIALETFGATGGIDAAGLLEEINQAVDRWPRWPYPMPYRALEADRCRPSPEPRPMPLPAARFRRMIMPYEPRMKDSSTFFKEAKTFVLSNIPVVTAPCPSYRARGRSRVYYRQQTMLGAPAPMAMEDSGPMAAGPSKTASNKEVVKKKIKARIRTFFPETWKFELLEDPKPTFALTAPDSMTTWKSTMYCVTSKGLGLGLGLSPPDRLVVFQPFFLQMALPYSLIRGETAKIPVKVFSYLKGCSELVLTMKPSKALSSSGAQQVTSCLCNFGQMTAYFRVQPSQLGKVPIEVEAVSRPSKRCPNPKGSQPVAQIADAVRRTLLVKSEGIPEEMSFGDLLCPAGGSVSTTLEVTALAKTGLTIAEGSVRAYLTWLGNVIGSSLENLDNMVRMPYGCGEQNMASLVPSIYVLDYFTKAGIQKKDVIDMALKFIAIGHQRQLNYRLDDGSYSAFGKRDKVGSTWLTAFVFKSFVAAKKYTEIDTQVLTSALSFLLSKTRKSGCFREDGRVFSSSLKGGQGSGKDEVAITAYILGALLEANEADPSLKNATAPGIAAAVRCLNATASKKGIQLKEISNYGVAVRAYALTKWNATNSLTKKFQNELLRRQFSKDGFKYWKAKNDEAKPPSARPWRYFVSADVETTAYALLTQLELMDSAGSSLVKVLPILRWLTSQRNEQGGWYSTQDTVMALQTLTSFARRTSGPGKGTDLSVKIESSEGKREVKVTNDNKLVLSKIPISAPNSVKVTASGNGCLVAQAIVLFNVIDSGRAGAPFALSTSASQSKDRCDQSNVRVCVRYTGPSKQSGMAVVKADMPSGWQVTRKSIEDLNENVAEGGLKLIEVDPDKSLVLYFDSFTASEACVTVTLQRDIEVAGVKPMPVQVYDYYKPHETQESSVQVVTKVCEQPQSDDPQTKCPLCTGVNDTAIAAVERLCSKPHYFAAVERREGGKWRYTQRVGDMILVWNAALKVPETCKCRVSPRAFIAVHTKWWSLSMDESVTLSGDWTVVNVDSLSKKGRQKLKASCARKSGGFMFGYNMFERQDAEKEEKSKAMERPEIEPPESMCFLCSEDIDPNLRSSISKEISAKSWTIARVTETYDGEKAVWALKDLKGKSYGSRNVNYKSGCDRCKYRSKELKEKDLLVLSKKSWKLNLQKQNEVIIPDGSFYIGFYDDMVKLFPELKMENDGKR